MKIRFSPLHFSFSRSLLLPFSHSKGGFTLIEVLIYMGIFSAVIISFLGILTAVTRIQVRQLAAAEVQSQSQFLLQTFQRSIASASYVDITPDSETSTLTLRMATSTLDPTTIRLSSGVVQLQEGGGAWQDLTSSNVTVSNLNFIRRNNFPGHDAVDVSLVVAYAAGSTNVLKQFSQTLNVAVARVMAATFNANVTPGASNYKLGTTAAPWWSINDTLYFSGSNVGIGEGAPASALVIAGGDLYLDTAGRGFIFNQLNCFLVTVLDSGNLQSASTTCP